MEIKKVEFVKSLGVESEYVPMNMPEIAVAGRSNVGKSSFINMLGRNKKLARVSETPGKTRLINIFNFDGKFMLMDLPGYGYAKVSDREKERFGQLIEGYLHTSTDLKNVFLLLDIRHAPTAQDKQMLNWLYMYSVPFTVIATKADQVPASKLNNQVNMLARECGILPDMIIVTSSLAGKGRDKVLKRLSEIISRDV